MIPIFEAEELLALFCNKVITKVRYRLPFAGKIWEVDVFSGENEGLIVAEIELDAEDEQFELPDWIGREVSREERYYNSNLSVHPYSKW
jgi:adenylate cyclase